MVAKEYFTTILPDGHIPIPEEIKKELILQPNSQVRVILIKEKRSDRKDRFKGILKTLKESKCTASIEEIVRSLEVDVD